MLSFALGYIFSQIDKLEELDAAKKETEIMEQEISGTNGTIIDITPENDVPDFDIKVDKELHSELRNRINEVANIANTLHIHDASTFISHFNSRISGQVFQKIAFVGRYSTGKSSLINALLGKSILPTSPIPTTKSITYIMKGENDCLYSEDGNGDIIIHDSIDDLVDLYKNSAKSMQKVSLALRGFPFDNLAIADTPGLEEPDDSVAQLTLDILPDTDAIVVLLDANYMESRVEFEFISSLLKNDKERKLFIVINKVDNMDLDTIVRLKKLCHSHLIEYGIPTNKIHALSTKNGCSGIGVSEFKNDLSHFIKAGIKAEAQRQIQKELEAYSLTLLDACAIAVAQASLDGKSKKENLRAITEKISEIKDNYDKQKRKTLKKFSQYRSQFSLEFSSFIDKLKASVRQEIFGSKLDTLKNTDGIASKIKNEIVKFADGKISEINDNLQADLHGSQTEIRSFLSHLQLPIDVKARDYSCYAGIFLPAVVATSWVCCGFFSFIWVVVAAIVGRNFFETSIAELIGKVGINSVREKIAEQACANLDKAKAQLEWKFNDAFDTMEKEIITSFEIACAAASNPLSLVSTESVCSVDEITACRERLTKIVNI